MDLHIALSVSNIILTCLVIARGFPQGDGLTSRERRGHAKARSAVRYAEALGGSAREKLTHAVQGFRRLDPKNEFPDNVARILIEAVLTEEP